MSEAACKAVICGNKAAQELCKHQERFFEYVNTAINWIDSGDPYPELQALYMIKVSELTIKALASLEKQIADIPQPV
jgi:hypothetical protein